MTLKSLFFLTWTTCSLPSHQPNFVVLICPNSRGYLFFVSYFPLQTFCDENLQYELFSTTVSSSRKVVHKLRPCPHYAGGSWKRSFISTVRPTVHTNRHANALRTGQIWKRRLFVFVWTKSILKTELLENDGTTIIMWFPRPGFSKKQLQNDRWLLRFWIPPA